MKRSKVILLLLVIAALSVTAFSQSAKLADRNSGKPKTTEAVGDVTADDYDRIVAKLNERDLEVDFDVLRRAYTKTSNYAPYGGGDARNQMNKALEADEYQKALENCRKTP